MKIFLLRSLSLLMALAAVFTSSFDRYLPKKIPAAKTEAELASIDAYIEKYETNDTVAVIANSAVSSEERTAFYCLQGLANRESVKITLDTGSSGVRAALTKLKNNGTALLYNDTDGNKWTFGSLLKEYLYTVTDNGYIIYDSTDNGQVNMATNYASIYGWLMLPRELENTADDLGMTKKADMNDTDCSVKAQYKFYLEHKSEFRNNCIVHQRGDKPYLRDLAVQQKIFTIFVSEDNKTDVYYRTAIILNMKRPAAVLGWGSDELKYVRSVSATGNFVIPSDYCNENSFLCTVKDDGAKYTPKTDSPSADPTKHYIALVCSDGDNIQWVQNGYGTFNEKITNFNDITVSWTQPPLLREFSYADYETITAKTDEYNSLICGVSGAGYINPSKMPDKYLEAFSDITASYMKSCGYDIITILDTAPETKHDEKVFIHKLGYFSRYDNIRGGILELDPDRYESGKGKIYFSDGKPFISVRLSLWYPTSNANDVTREWLREQAQIVNGYPADISSENGYSVINIHPWTIDPDDLAYFVSLLDDHIEQVSADELVSLVKENVK